MTFLYISVTPSMGDMANWETKQRQLFCHWTRLASPMWQPLFALGLTKFCLILRDFLSFIVASYTNAIFSWMLSRENDINIQKLHVDLKLGVCGTHFNEDGNVLLFSLWSSLGRKYCSWWKPLSDHSSMHAIEGRLGGLMWMSSLLRFLLWYVIELNFQWNLLTGIQLSINYHWCIWLSDIKATRNYLNLLTCQFRLPSLEQQVHTSTVYWCIASKLKAPWNFYWMSNMFLWVEIFLFLCAIM